MKIKRFLPFVCLPLLLTSLTGCGKKGLLIWTFSDEMSKICKKYYKGEVTIVEKTSVTQVTADLANVQFSKRNIPDIVCLEAAVIAKLTDKKLKDSSLLSLDDIKGTDQMYDYTKSVAKTVDGHLLGLSWQATPGGFFYKEDIAKKVGINSVEEMETKISTWEGYLDLAESCKAKKIAVCSSISDPIKVFLGARSKGWVDSKNVLQMEDVMFGPTTEGVYNCFDVVRDLHQKGYTHQTSDRDKGWFKDIPSNNTLGYFCSSWGLSFDLMPNAGKTSGKWKMCKAPVNYFKGGTWLAIPKGAEKVDEAKEFIKFLTTDQEFLKARGKETGDFMNSKSVMKDLAKKYSCEFLGGQNHLTKLYEVAEKVNGELISPYDATIDSAFQSVAGDYAQRATGTSSEIEEERELQKDNFITSVRSKYNNIVVPE